MRVKREDFYWALDDLENEHQLNSKDEINIKSAEFYKNVTKVSIPWWTDWIKSPYDDQHKFVITYHQLTKFAAVISAVEREKSAAVADDLIEPKSGNKIRRNTAFGFWPDYFPE